VYENGPLFEAGGLCVFAFAKVWDLDKV
jgi:hypothetical protein